MRNAQEHLESHSQMTSKTNFEDALTKEEIFYTGKRNIEGYATLVNFFLPKLISSGLNSSIINVDNSESSSQLFF